MNRTIGTVSIIIGMIILFISPVIFDWYFKYFNLKCTDGNGCTVFMSLFLIIVVFVVGGLITIIEKPFKK